MNGFGSKYWPNVSSSFSRGWKVFPRKMPNGRLCYSGGDIDANGAKGPRRPSENRLWRRHALIWSPLNLETYTQTVSRICIPLTSLPDKEFFLKPVRDWISKFSNLYSTHRSFISHLPIIQLLLSLCTNNLHVWKKKILYLRTIELLKSFL